MTAYAGAYSGAGLFGEVAAAGDTAQGLVVEALSKSGNCFYIADSEPAAGGAPTIGYAESVGCAAPTAITLGAPTAGRERWRPHRRRHHDRRRRLVPQLVGN